MSRSRNTKKQKKITCNTTSVELIHLTCSYITYTGDHFRSLFGDKAGWAQAVSYILIYITMS